MNKIDISIVTPVYGCGRSLDTLYLRLEKTLSKITSDFEIIMVNDASPDNAWETIKLLAQKDPRVKGINLSRNFGQHKAINVGLNYTQGDWVVVMDCDLQDQPEEILKLYSKAQEGYDIVFGRRTNRKDKFLKKLASKLFYKVYNYLTEYDVDPLIANFSIVSNKVVENFRKLSNQHKPYRSTIKWLGFKDTDIEIIHANREEGESSYNFKKLMLLAGDNIISQSNKPLKLSIKIGFLISFFSASYAFYLIFKYFMSGILVAGWTSVIVSIYFVGGLLFMNLGFIGLYIGKIFEETKNKPLYIIDETTFMLEEKYCSRKIDSEEIL